MSVMANSRTGESVLDRLDAILGTFSASDDQLSATEIARRTAIPLATAHRLCLDLTRHQWLESTPAGFVIGTRLWELSNRSSRTTKLAVQARPYLSDIHAIIGQHVQVGVIEAREVLFVDRLSGHRAPTVHGGVADRLPLHSSATGVVLLAHSSHAFRHFYREALDDHSEHRSFVCEERLEQVRREGYCAQTGAIEPSITGVAVPVRSRTKEVIAGLGVVTDAADIAQRPAPWVQLLQVAARGIQRELRGDL